MLPSGPFSVVTVLESQDVATIHTSRPEGRMPMTADPSRTPGSTTSVTLEEVQQADAVEMVVHDPTGNPQQHNYKVGWRG